MGTSDPPIVGGENATPSPRLNHTKNGTVSSSPSRKPVDAWCDDGSVSRAEPPWLRDRRLKLKGEQRDSLSSRLIRKPATAETTGFIRKAATTETTGSTFDSAEQVSPNQTNDNMYSNNLRNPASSSSPSHAPASSPSHSELYKNPYASTPPGALSRPSQSFNNNPRNPFESPTASRVTVTTKNPFESPTASRATVTTKNPFESQSSIPRFRGASVRQQQNGIKSPNSSRPPNRRSTNPFDGPSKEEDSSIKDASVEMDSLDQILDRTDVTVEESTQEGRSGGGGASAGENSSQETSLSEKALKAAELLKRSFDQPSLSRTQTTTPSQQSQSRSSHSGSSTSARRVTPERYYRKPTTATIPEETPTGSNSNISPPTGPCPLVSPSSSRRQSTTQPVRPMPQRSRAQQQQQQQQQPTLSFSLMNVQRQYEEPPPTSQKEPVEQQKEQMHNSLIDDGDDDSFPQEASIVDDDDDDAESYDEVLSDILDPPPNTTYDNNSEMADVGEEQEVVYMSNDDDVDDNDDDDEPRGYSFRDDEDEEAPSGVDYGYSFREHDVSASRGGYSLRDEDEEAPRGYSFRDEDEDDDVVITIDDDDEVKIGTDDSSRLALHDLCDEARAKDDIAWHNALYLLSVKPELCTEREQICQMNPLHVCCLSTAPVWMTRALLYTRPEQCQETDVGGRFPLHLCVAMSADLDTMQLLVQEYPASVSHKDKRGFTPLHLLLKNDQITLTLEHLRILLGQTTDPQQQQKHEAKRLHFRKSEHLDAKLEELEAMKKRQEEHHESMFTDYPEDVQRTLNKITQWKRRQISKGNMINDTNFVYDYIQPASIPTPAGKLLPLHLLVRRKPSDDDITRSRIILSSTRRLPPGSTLDLCRVLIHAYPEALITRDAGGRTPLLTAMLQTDSLPSEEVVETLLGLRTSQPLDISPAKFAADDSHQLPLHVAAEEMTSNYELLATICEAYPEGIEKQDLRGRTPLHLAVGNYRATRVDESLLELLTNKHVAKTRDFDGNRPLDWILEHPDCLVQRDDSLVFQQFLDDSIGPPPETNYWEHSNDLIRQMQMLPPWLRRQACTAKYVQAALLEQVTMPKNTFGVLLWGCVLVALLVMVRLLLDEQKTSYIFTVYILSSYLLARQVVRCMAATFLGEFYAVVLASPWTYVHWVSGLISILLAHTIASEAAAFEALLGPGTFESFEKQETLIDSLGAFTTAALWLSILGFLVEWWCGMAIAFGSAVQVLKTLFWPFVVAGIGIVAASQVLYTLEDCSGDICPLSETYSTVYLTILGEPVLTEDESLPRDTMIVLIVFSVLAVWWLLSVIVLAVSEAQSLDRRQIALQWYWEPKVTLVWTRNVKPIELTDQPSCTQRYCDRMEELWFVLTSLIKGDNNKRRDLHWYASCSRPGFWRCFMSPFALLFIPVWIVMGAVTLGLLWPPQVRRWLFATTMISKEKTTPIEDRLTGSKLSQLKGEWHKFQETSMERNARLQEDISQIKDILIRAMLEDEKQT